MCEEMFRIGIKNQKAISVLASAAYTKIGTIQRRVAWPLCKDDTQIREAFHIFEAVVHIHYGTLLSH